MASEGCEYFQNVDLGLFGERSVHVPGGPCKHYRHPGGCIRADIMACETEGFKIKSRLDQESDSE